VKEIRLQREFPRGVKALYNQVKREGPQRSPIKHAEELLTLLSSGKAGRTRTGYQTIEEGECSK